MTTKNIVLIKKKKKKIEIFSDPESDPLFPEGDCRIRVHINMSGSATRLFPLP